MQKRLIMILLFSIWIMSLATFISVLKYVDPYGNTVLSLSALGVSFVLMFSSMGTLLVYFFKKIYYRGDVYIYHVYTSFRQSLLGAGFGVFYVILHMLSVPVFFPLLLGGGLLVCLELFFQNIESN